MFIDPQTTTSAMTADASTLPACRARGRRTPYAARLKAGPDRRKVLLRCGHGWVHGLGTGSWKGGPKRWAVKPLPPQRRPQRDRAAGEGSIGRNPEHWGVPS